MTDVQKLLSEWRAFQDIRIKAGVLQNRRKAMQTEIDALYAQGEKHKAVIDSLFAKLLQDHK